MPESEFSRWARPAAILVATDLSDMDRLMPFAIEQGIETGARLILLHVVAGAEAMSQDMAGMPYYDPAGVFELAAKTLESCCTEAQRQNVRCEALVREGNATRQILSAARQFGADRILLGTRGRGKLTRLLLGSVAEQVLRSVNLPVITVGPEAHREVVESTPERVVLHATTLSEASRPSAALACQIAAIFRARLVLLNVLPHMDEIERNGPPAGLESAAKQQLRDMAAEMSCASIDVESRVVHGNPAIEILAEAAGLNARLIVLSSAQHSALEYLTRDGTVYKVIAHARCPVITLREPPGVEIAREFTQDVLHV